MSIESDIFQKGFYSSNGKYLTFDCHFLRSKLFNEYLFLKRKIVHSKVIVSKSECARQPFGTQGQNIYYRIVRIFTIFTFIFKKISSNTGAGKSRFTVVSTGNTTFTLVLLFNNYCIFHTNNCRPTFANPCIHDITITLICLFCMQCIAVNVYLIKWTFKCMYY